MCNECQEWLHEVIEKTKPATRQAFKVFLNTLEAIIPEFNVAEFNSDLCGYEHLE